MTTFARLLTGSPVLVERKADEYYNLCRQYTVDPLFILGMFKHESDLGRRFSFSQPTKSWGNTGFPTFGPEPATLWQPDGHDVIVTVKHPLTGKEFPVYSTWLDGLHATLARLTSPNWKYYNRPTIEEIFVHPSGAVWAPAGDRNNPAGYVNSVVTYMNMNTEVAMPNALAKVTTRQANPMLAWNAPNNAKAIMTGQWPDYITIHETGNQRVGTNAEMHRRFVIENGGGTEGVSFHAVVDSKESIQLMPWNWVAWHAGDGGQGTGNRDSIAIETCQNVDGNFAATVANLVVLTAKLMKEFNIPLERVVQHNHWSGKNCPEFLRSGLKGPTWAGFRAAVSAAAKSATEPQAFQHAPGWLAPIVDTFDWGKDSAGIIVERQILVYNDEKREWYRGIWRAESGVVWEKIA